jgi:predicted nucleic acid-binding protein
VRIYLDAAPVIYTVENVPQYAAAVDARLSVPGVVLVVSDLTRLECRVKPLREGNLALLRDFDDYFEGVVSQVVVLSRAVMDRATEIRAGYGFRTPDAIQLAAATLAHCEVFLTNDQQLGRFPEITVEMVQP